MPRHFPPPWTVEQIPGGYKVKDANGHALAYVYARLVPPSRYQFGYQLSLATAPLAACRW